MSEQSAQLAGGDLAGMHPIEARLFSSLDDDGDGLVSKAGFLAELGRNGLSRKDPRLSELFAGLDAVNQGEREDGLHCVGVSLNEFGVV